MNVMRSRAKSPPSRGVSRTAAWANKRGQSRAKSAMAKRGTSDGCTESVSTPSTTTGSRCERRTWAHRIALRTEDGPRFAKEEQHRQQRYCRTHTKSSCHKMTRANVVTKKEWARLGTDAWLLWLLWLDVGCCWLLLLLLLFGTPLNVCVCVHSTSRVHSATC